MNDEARMTNDEDNDEVRAEVSRLARLRHSSFVIHSSLGISSFVIRRSALWLLLPLALLTSCQQDTTPPPRVEWAFEREFTGGPVSLIVRLDRVEASLADQITMEQELRADPGFETEFPEYLPEDFEGLSVVGIDLPRSPVVTAAASTDGDSSDSGAAPGAGGSKVTVSRKRLTLEPDRSGELFIAPLAVYFHAADQQEGAAEESSFMTEEIPLQISRPEDIAELELKDPRDIYTAPPVEKEGSALPWVLGGGLAAVALAVGVYLLRHRKALIPPPTPPHEIAYEALRRLVALDLVEKGEIELFFVYLSKILRDYVENRFEVMAPERTTEEFLQEAASHAALGGHQARLGRFLTLCDQVKFARFEPDDATIQEAFDVVKQFLAETKSDVV